MIELAPGDVRIPVKHLNYPGDVTAGLSAGQPLGPNDLGELLWPVAAQYDAADDCTRVGLSFVSPPTTVGAS